MQHAVEISEPIKAAMDIVSIGIVIGWFTEALPAMATILTLVWTGLRVYESVLSIRLKRARLDAKAKSAPPE